MLIYRAVSQLIAQDGLRTAQLNYALMRILKLISEFLRMEVFLKMVMRNDFTDHQV